MSVHEVSLLDVTVGVWCAMSATRITEPVLSNTTRLLRYIVHILTPSFKIHFGSGIPCTKTPQQLAKQATLCFVERVYFWQKNITQGILAPSFDRFEPLWFLGLLVVHV